MERLVALVREDSQFRDALWALVREGLKDRPELLEDLEELRAEFSHLPSCVEARQGVKPK